jgi:hypothetical protein
MEGKLSKRFLPKTSLWGGKEFVRATIEEGDAIAAVQEDDGVRGGIEKLRHFLVEEVVVQGCMGGGVWQSFFLSRL